VVLGNSDLADTVEVAHLPSIFTDSRVLGVVRNHALHFFELERLSSLRSWLFATSLA
jgi:hypothetical protein